MPQFSCQYCGQSFSIVRSTQEARETYCNLGCALRARVRVDADGNFPVNQHLVAALVTGFLFFNQALTAGAALMLVARGRTENSHQLAWVSFAFGVFVWLATLVLQQREKVARGKDYAFGGATLAILLAAIWRNEPRVGLALAATGVLLIWNLRGLIYHQQVVKFNGQE